ncbi:glycosyltransferase family 9 protein [Maribacter sp. 2304DJ31-5]|uniref:glycosyltransferase family 9 protein n=1 Tax=Maribacter sp. 2304DJ31-5 TaxID=3386273 RepID=UPI0039BD5762
MKDNDKYQKEISHSRVEGFHILVIRLSAMGDVAMAIHVLLALMAAYPELKVTVLTKSFFKPIFSQLPNVTVFAADVKGKHKGIQGLWKLYRELRRLEIDTVADLHNVMRSNVLKGLFKLSGTPFVQIDKGRAEKKALTAKKNKHFKQLRTTHERYADVFGKLGFKIDLKPENVLPRQEINFKKPELPLSEQKKWIGIAPFAAFSGKMYPLPLMEEVLDRLNNLKNCQVLLFGGGPSEQRQLEKWENQFSNCMNIAGRIDLDEQLALISNLDAMVAMDSGNAHLSAMFGIPTITLWGVTHPFAGFYPFGQSDRNALLADRDQFPLIPTSVYGNAFPKGYENAMETIGPEHVIQKIKSVLDSR